jgi:signal transduction histidine kinase
MRQLLPPRRLRINLTGIRCKSYISGASLAIQQVWNLVERASRATDAEAFVRQAILRFIDLETLIADIVVIYRQTCSGVYIHLEAKDNVLVRADPSLIKEGVENLLSNAVSLQKTTVQSISC